MPKKEPLFELIKSLSQNEKRYFKQFSKLQKDTDNNAYVKLFDLIEQQKIYNEAKLIQIVSSYHFAQHKRHLYKKIMESLRLFHSDKTIDVKIASHLTDYDILINKSLISQASKVLHKAKNLAIANEKYTDIIKINKLESQLLWTEDKTIALVKQIGSYKKAAKEILYLIENQILFEKEYLNIINWNKRIEFVRNEQEIIELRAILNQPLFENENKAFSLAAKIHFHYIKALFHFFIGEFTLSEKHFSEQLTLLNDNEAFRKEAMFLYVKSLSNFTLLNFKLKKQNQISIGIETLKGITKQNKQVQNYVDYVVYLFELMQFNLQLKYKKATKYIESNSAKIIEIENWLCQQNIMNIERSYVLFNSIEAFMNTEDCKSALKIMNSYLNKETPSFKDDVYCIAIILNLFIHFELENKDLIEYNLISVERYLKTKKRMYNFEKTILKFIQNALKSDSTFDLKNEFIKLKIQLTKIRDMKFEKNVFEYFDFLTWIDKKCI